MITAQRLDELDALAAETQKEHDIDEYECLENLDEIAIEVPQLTAEIRRLWAELERSDQNGMVDLLRESRLQTCT